MKIKNLLFSAFVALTLNVTAQQQDTLAAWLFPDGSADSLIDVSISLNSSRYISCEYGTYGTPSYMAIPIDYTTNGSLGAPDKCAKVTGLENGADSACFIVKFKSTGYSNLKLYSKQSAGGNNPGPRDFKVQYKLSGSSSPWIDLTGGTVICANDWTTGVIDGISLPSACDNQGSNISIRWIQTSNLDINGNALLASGIAKIDDIVITGDVMTGIHTVADAQNINIYPNPSNGSFAIELSTGMTGIKIYNTLGQCVYTNEQVVEELIFFNGFEKGVYFVQFTKTDGSAANSKLIVK